MLSKEEIEKAKNEGYEIIRDFRKATTEFTKDILPKKANAIKILIDSIDQLETEHKELKADKQRLIEKLEILKDSEEFKNNMCKHRCIKYNEILDLQSKANKYDSLIKEIEDKKEKLEKEYKDAIDKNSTKAFILKCQITIIQELLDKEKEEI